jgi:hypothetical protein
MNNTTISFINLFFLLIVFYEAMSKMYFSNDGSRRWEVGAYIFAIQCDKWHNEAIRSDMYAYITYMSPHLSDSPYCEQTQDYIRRIKLIMQIS